MLKVYYKADGTPHFVGDKAHEARRIKRLKVDVSGMRIDLTTLKQAEKDAHYRGQYYVNLYLAMKDEFIRNAERLNI